MVPLIGFCGASGSGKTTLVEKIIVELASRGLKVGAIKHHGHEGTIAVSAEMAQKDTSRLERSGSSRTILAHSNGVNLNIGEEAAKWTPVEIASRLMYDMDIVIVEGFKNADIQKIEVVAPDKEPILPQGGKILAITRRGFSGEEKEMRLLDADDPVSVADFVMASAFDNEKKDDFGVRVRIQGRDLPVNGFSQRIIENTIRGLLAGFKGGDKPGKIEVSIEPKS